MGVSDEDRETAERLRWGMSRLASRLRAKQPGRPEALTRMAASVLAHLRHSGPLTPTELASIEGLRAQSLTRVLNELEEQGRVVRSCSDEDRRRQPVSITPEGEAALRAHVRDGNAWLAAAMHQTLSPTERGLLRLTADLLHQLATSDVLFDPEADHPTGTEPACKGAAPVL